MKINYIESNSWDKFKKDNHDVFRIVFHVYCDIEVSEKFGPFIISEVYWMEELEMHRYFYPCNKEGCQKVLRIYFANYIFNVYETDKNKDEIKVELHAINK